MLKLDRRNKFVKKRALYYMKIEKEISESEGNENI